MDDGVTDLLQVLADQPECAGSDPDDIALGKRRGTDALPVDEGAARAIQVHDAADARHEAQLGVVAGDGGVGDDDVVVRRPAQAQAPGGRRQADPTAQDQPVSGMSEPDQALPADLDPIDPLARRIGAVGAGVVRQDPAAILQPKHRVPPGHAGIGDNDLALRIAAHQVRRAGRQGPLGTLDPHHDRRCGSPWGRIVGTHSPTVGRDRRFQPDLASPGGYNYPLDGIDDVAEEQASADGVAATGELLRDLTLDPARNYQPTGAPKGPP